MTNTDRYRFGYYVGVERFLIANADEVNIERAIELIEETIWQDGHNHIPESSYKKCKEILEALIRCQR